jgi:hypothetical protein
MAGAVLHGLERDDTKGVVGKMGEEVDKQDEPGRQPYPHNDAARFNHASMGCRADRGNEGVAIPSGMVLDSADRIRAISATP